jgi:hypothetical protein
VILHCEVWYMVMNIPKQFATAIFGTETVHKKWLKSINSCYCKHKVTDDWCIIWKLYVRLAITGQIWLISHSQYGMVIHTHTVHIDRWPGLCSQYTDFLWTGQSGVLTPVGVRFSVPIQTSTQAHQASCTMSTSKRSWGINHPSAHCANIKERVQLHFNSPSWP